MSKKGIIGIICAALAILIVIFCFIFCLERIPAGYVGVVYNINGGIEGETLTQGWHLVAPTKKVTTYSIGIEQSYLTSEDKGDSEKDESFNVPTSDGKTVRVDLEFSYYFDESRVAQTFTMFKGENGKTVKNTFIKPKIAAWTQEVSANYPVADFFGDKRTEINTALDKHLKEKFYQYGIIIDTVNLTNAPPDEETAKAIQKKVNAQQELELAQIEAQTAQIKANKDKQVALIQAEQQKEVASKNAEKQIIEAEGKAKALKIEAKAEADANKEIAESLTEELIDKIKIKQWNGVLPVVTSDNTPIIDMGSLK